MWGTLVSLGMSFFGRLFGGGGPASEAYDMKAAPPVPVSNRDLLIGASLIGLGIYLRIRR